MKAIVTSLMKTPCFQVVTNQHWTDYMHGKRNSMRKSGYISKLPPHILTVPKII